MSKLQDVATACQTEAGRAMRAQISVAGRLPKTSLNGTIQKFAYPGLKMTNPVYNESGVREQLHFHVGFCVFIDWNHTKIAISETDLLNSLIKIGVSSQLRVVATG
jgi:hypothetical protein